MSKMQQYIESKSNKIVKQVSGLLLPTKKFREATGRFAVEGEKFISSIPRGWDVSYYVCSESYAKTKNLAAAPIYVLRDDIFKSVSDTVNPQGVIAVCKKKGWIIENILKYPSGERKNNLFILICEDIQDPGNLGTLIRTADACGCDGLVLSTHSADIYNPKVIRATAGSIFNIPIVLSENLTDTVFSLKSEGISLYAAHLKASVSLFETEFSDNSAVLIGNEAHGLSGKLSGMADFPIKIPIIGKAESLNASTASAVIMYEALRQRSL